MTSADSRASIDARSSSSRLRTALHKFTANAQQTPLKLRLHPSTMNSFCFELLRTDGKVEPRSLFLAPHHPRLNTGPVMILVLVFTS